METGIKTILKKAEALVSESEISSDLRPAAFREVFRLLVQTEMLDPNHAASPKKPLPKAGPEIKPRNGPGVRVNSPATLIDKMIQSGYFKTKRKYDECQGELKIKGFNIPPKTLATVLLRKVRSGLLHREQTEKGKYVYFSE